MSFFVYDASLVCVWGGGLESKTILKGKFSLLGNTRVQVRTILYASVKLCGHESLYRRKKETERERRQREIWGGKEGKI